MLRGFQARGIEGPGRLADGCFWRVHSSVRIHSQATCASRADDPGRSKSRSWRRKRGTPADETRPDKALSEGCMKGATVDRLGDIKID